MPSTSVSELIRLPAAERAAVAIALWDSLSDAERDAEFGLTPEQAVDLDRRWAEHLKAPSSATPCDNVRRLQQSSRRHGSFVRHTGSSGRPEERTMIQAVDVEPRAGYRIWLQYSDGAAGEVDLSRLAGRGVFAAWEDRTFFESVEIRGGRVVAWSDEIDLCADALYLQLTGKPVQDLMPGAWLRSDA